MAFEVGDTVTPVVNLNNNGTEVPTTGVQGTVLARQNVATDSSGNILYAYQVQLSQAITFGEGDAAQTGQVFWFSESDLGNTQSTTSVLPDEGTVATAVNTAKSTTDSSASVIGQMKNNIDPKNPYYDTLSSYQKILESNSTALSSSVINSSDSSDLARQGTGLMIQSDNLVTTANITQELSENVYGFYTVTSEVETQLRQEQAQAEVQDALAAEDDSLTFSTFVSTFIDSPTVGSLMVPDTSATPQTVSGLSNVDQLKGINPADLITEALDLEQG